MSKPFPDPYRLADKTIAELNRRMLRRYEFVKSRLVIEGFDELNIMKRIDALYEELDADNRKAFKKLYCDRFIEVTDWLGVKKVDYLDELAEMSIAGLLSEPNPVLKYIYDAEVTRKRDRAKEAVIAAKGTDAKLFELRKATRIWSQMTSWYTDLSSQTADAEAFLTADVDRVQWHSQKDEKVCAECHEKDGVIYPIDALPPKPHPGCRCYFTPVSRAKKGGGQSKKP